MQRLAAKEKEKAAQARERELLLAAKAPLVLWNTGYVFSSHLAQNLEVHEGSNRPQSTANSRQGDTSFLLIPNTGAFLPES